MGNMDCCLSAEERRAIAVSKEIDKQLMKDKSLLRKTVKLLLLGACESGKSTIMKQMRIIHKGGFTEKDYQEYRPIVYQNTFESLEAIIQAMTMLKIDYANQERQNDAKLVLEAMRNMLDYEPFSGELLEAMKHLWADAGFQQCYLRSNEYPLNCYAKYFLDSLDRLSQPSYLPTVQDILRTSVVTTEVVQIEFDFKDHHFL